MSQANYHDLRSHDLKNVISERCNFSPVLREKYYQQIKVWNYYPG